MESSMRSCGRLALPPGIRNALTGSFKQSPECPRQVERKKGTLDQENRTFKGMEAWEHTMCPREAGRLTLAEIKGMWGSRAATVHMGEKTGTRKAETRVKSLNIFLEIRSYKYMATREAWSNEVSVFKACIEYGACTTCLATELTVPYCHTLTAPHISLIDLSL